MSASPARRPFGAATSRAFHAPPVGAKLTPMPRPPEDVRRRLEELIARCDGFVPPNAKEPVRVPAQNSELWRFLISSLQTVGSSCGKESPHLRELERCRTQFVETKIVDIDTCRGVLEAARDDLAAGMLADLRRLVTAEAFGDLLESAAHLADEGYTIPAIAVAGAVLESSLRVLAKSRNVVWQGTSGISKINTALYTANVYDKVVYGEIEAWGKLRNQVDHGEFTQASDVDARAAHRMVDGVRDFVAKGR